MVRLILWVFCLASTVANSHAGELYRWMDSSGVIHYSDMAPPKNVQVETKNLSSPVNPEESLPYETRRAQQNFPVTLYVADDCEEACKHALELLNKRGIPFILKSLKTSADLNAFKALAGFNAVPALSVGKTFLRGFEASQWHAELDISGYPKTAPYRPVSTSVAPASQVAPNYPSVQ